MLFLLKNPGGGKEDAFGFGDFLSSPHVHLKTKASKVLVNEVNSTCELVVILEMERSIVQMKDTKEGKRSSLFEVLLFVTGESSHILG